MNKTELLGRITQIENAIGQALNTYQTLVGQKTEAQFWLSELEKATAVVSDIVDASKATSTAVAAPAANDPKVSK